MCGGVPSSRPKSTTASPSPAQLFKRVAYFSSECMTDSEVYRWLDHARADLRVASEILQPDWDYIAFVLFLVQQAAEKSLKGLLQYKFGTAPPRIHSLAKLSL